MENRSTVTLAQIPALVQRAIIAVEDNNFYIHSGVDLKATVRALFTNVQAGAVEQGGSTITMQLVKNTLLSPKQDLSRKTQEAVLAWRLEQEMSKDEIAALDGWIAAHRNSHESPLLEAGGRT